MAENNSIFLNEGHSEGAAVGTMEPTAAEPAGTQGTTAASERAGAVFLQWIESFPDLSYDTLQPIFQYYFADRKEKMQDYTPQSLARLTAQLAAKENERRVVDMCAGSGALTIQKWNTNKNLFFYCVEFDSRVIPFLIFNLAIRNIGADVIHGDVLSGEQFAVYKLTKGERFSSVEKCSETVKIAADSCISNPPYNMRWNAIKDDRFEIVPPASNANFAFVLTATASAERSALILPAGVLTPNTKEEKAILNYLITNNLVDTVIMNPDRMFEATTIGTCILVLDKHKKTDDIAFIDMRQTYTEVEREQNGQFGGASHTGRTYKKIVKVYSDDDISKLFKALLFRTDIKEFCVFVNREKIDIDSGLAPSRYIKFDDESADEHRRYADIAHSINLIRAERNACKLTINQTLAKDFGFDVEIYKADSDDDTSTNELLKKLGAEALIKNDYISFTKKAGEMSFANREKDSISSILVFTLQQWKQHIYFLNEVENKYLTELRDALLPDLMSGKIEV